MYLCISMYIYMYIYISGLPPISCRGQVGLRQPLLSLFAIHGFVFVQLTGAVPG